MGRTFPSRTLTKTKINVIQSEVEKYDHIETLRQLLRLYAVYDSEVGYVQGMNMVAAPIVMHMRDMTASFIYFKEVMTYGKLRLFFIEDFSGIKQEVREKFRKLLRFHNIELYQYLVHIFLCRKHAEWTIRCSFPTTSPFSQRWSTSPLWYCFYHSACGHK